MSDPTAERSHTQDEAAQWFARLNRRAVSTHDLRAFRDWRRAPRNAAAFAEISMTWDKAGALREDVDLRAATAEAMARRPASRLGALWPRRAALPLAAVALAALASLGGWYAFDGRDTYQTQVGEQRLEILADGSRVRLNTDSAIKVRFRQNEREVLLTRGEAFFEVAHDASRPFVVAAGAARVQALGTKFDVRRDAAAVQVTLVEGRVQVRQHATPASQILSPRQQVTVTAAGVTAPMSADTVRASGWTTGRLTFHETPLVEAVAEVNRYARRKIVIDDPHLGRAPVSGVFDTGDTDAFVSALKLVFDLQPAPGDKSEVRLIRGAVASD